MRDVMRNWTLREKYFENKNFPTQFCFSLSLECFGEISRESVKSTYAINSLKVDVLLSKSIARFQLIKIRNQLAPQWEIISPPETANQWDNRTSRRQWQQIKNSREKYRMANAVSYLALWNSEEDDNIMGKVAKGKEKTHDKKGEAGKNAENQDQESIDSLRNTFIAEISSLG